MRLILSNYGHRYITQRLRTCEPDEWSSSDKDRVLAEMWADGVRPHDQVPMADELMAHGFVEAADPAMTEETVRLRYARNPLENVQRVVFEYTTVCNLDCLHCRNGHLEAVSEKRPERLMAAADALIPLGIRYFVFIGGEVTMYGRGWLDVVRHIAGHEGAASAVITSGWFLEQKDFKAAGRRYADDAEYLAHLRESGLDHVIFSLDGPGEMHDRWRQVPGLYRRIMAGIPRVRAAGLTPRVSLVITRQLERDALTEWLVEVADAVYQLSSDILPEVRIARLTADKLNYLSNFIDVGNAATLTRGRHHIDDIPDDLLRCKNFFRPYPSLRIMASGELSLCPLIDAGEGYGSVRERGLIDVLNHMQDAFVYKLHADRRIASYRPYLDTSIFGEQFEHVCSLRTVLTMLARAMDERGVSPDDADAMRQLNLEVARKAGFLPQLTRKRATGNKSPV